MQKLARIQMSTLVFGCWNCRCSRGVFWLVCNYFKVKKKKRLIFFFLFCTGKCAFVHSFSHNVNLKIVRELHPSAGEITQPFQQPCLCLSCRGISLPLFLVVSFPLKPWEIDPALRQSVTLDKLPLRWGCKRGRTRWVDVLRHWHRERKELQPVLLLAPFCLLCQVFLKSWHLKHGSSRKWLLISDFSKHAWMKLSSLVLLGIMLFPGEGRNLDEVLGKVLVRENWKEVLC